jgi:DNA polymerase-3 subunit gamma/tau
VEEKKEPLLSVKISNVSSELKTPSIKIGLKKEEVKQDEQKERTNQQLPQENFTKEQLRYHWNNFGKRYKEHTTEFRILALEPVLEDTTTILIELENPVQEDVLNSIKPDILEYMRQSLANYSINIKAKVMEGNYTKKAFTINEKLQYLIDQNPMIAEFKKRFGLDTDY